MGGFDIGDDGDMGADQTRQRGDLPAWFMPTSNTPNAASGGMRASDSGTPQRLLWLAALALVLPCAASAWRSASLVPVLPALPVTATIRAALRSRA